VIKDATGDMSVGNTNTGVMPYAIDPDTAIRLWELSEQLMFAKQK